MGSTEITIQSDKQSLRVNNETYSLTKIPDSSSSLVQAEMQNVLHDLNLASILTDLDRAADLIYLAYNGVAGTGVLAASVSSKQKKLGDLCADCVITMTAFRQGTQDILFNLIDAFENLLAAEEEIALEILAECGDYAKDMSVKCEKLANGFNQLKIDTEKDSVSAEIAVGKQVDKLEEIRKRRAEMQATLNKQKENSEMLRLTLEELKTEITEAKEQEDKESERAFITGIVGAVTGAIGAGLGAFVAAKNPIATAASKIPSDTNTSQTTTKSSSDSVTEEQAKQNLAKEDLRKKQAALDLANEKLEAAKKEVEAAKKIVDTKQQALEKAQQSGNTQDTMVAEKDLEDATKVLAEANTKEFEAQKVKTSAQSKLEDKKAEIAALAATMDSISDKISNVEKKSEERAKSIRSHKNNLYVQKREAQRLRRESLSQIAELTSLLKSSDEDKEIEESSQHALEMAVWAFANVYAALSDAKFFWDNMAEYCKRLSNPHTTKLIMRNMKKEDKQKRILYYSSDRFMQTAIFYLVRWKALETICDEYITASQTARNKVMNNIRKQPTIAEARKQLDGLRATLSQKIHEEQVKSEQISVTLEEDRKLLQSVRV